MAFTVITPIPLILKALDDEIKLRYSDITTQYDPSMTYEETVKGVRYTRSSMAVDENQVFPLLAFSRSSVIGQEDIPRRQRPIRPRISDGVADRFQSRLCQFNYLFKFYERDVVMADTFEVMFGTHASINDIKTIIVNLPEVGDFEYQCIWRDLDETEFNKEDNFFISSAGSCIIHGQFIVMEDAPYPLIEQINLLIKDWTHNVTYRTITIKQVRVPVILPVSGAYPITESIVLTCGTVGADIYYTTDGSDPTIEDTLYTVPFVLGAACSIKAKAFCTGYLDSEISTNIYTII